MANVAVDSASRGRGVGRRLIEGAQAAAREHMAAQSLYAFVESANEVRGGLKE